MILRQLYTQQPTQQQLADYANAIIAVNSYAYAITNQTLPALQYTPANYADFATKFTPAKQHALNWIDNIFVAVIQLPVTIKEEASGMFDMEATLIEGYLTTLITTPADAKSKKGLAKALKDLQTVIQNQVTTITTIRTNLTGFSSAIYQDAKMLTGISQQALADVTDDKNELTAIQNDINALRADINQAQILLMVSEMAIGVSIFFTIVGVVVSLIPNGQMVGYGMIAVGVASTIAGIAGTVVENLRIKELEKEIAADQQQITGVNQDIILLNAVSTQFDALYDANQKAQTALTAIETMWTNLDSTIEDVKTELATVGTDTTGVQYQDALTAFGQAEKNWNEVVAFASTLANINYNWQDSSGTWHDYTAQNPQADQGKVTQVPSTIPQAA